MGHEAAQIDVHGGGTAALQHEVPEAQRARPAERGRHGAHRPRRHGRARRTEMMRAGGAGAGTPRAQGSEGGMWPVLRPLTAGETQLRHPPLAVPRPAGPCAIPARSPSRFQVSGHPVPSGSRNRLCRGFGVTRGFLAVSPRPVMPKRPLGGCSQGSLRDPSGKHELNDEPAPSLRGLAQKDGTHVK